MHKSHPFTGRQSGLLSSLRFLVGFKKPQQLGLRKKITVTDMAAYKPPMLSVSFQRFTAYAHLGYYSIGIKPVFAF